MLNSLLMAAGAIVFVGFWAYLAWDSRREEMAHCVEVKVKNDRS